MRPRQPVCLGCLLAIGACIGGALLGLGMNRFCPGDLIGEFRKTILVAQMLRGRRRAGGDPGEPVPAPHPPLSVDEPLTGHQASLQAAASLFALDPAGLREAASEGGWSGHCLRQRARAVRQSRGPFDRREAHPKAGRCRGFAIELHGCREFVMECCADRRLEAGGDLQLRKDRMVVGGARCWRKQRGERFCFSLEPDQPGFDLAQCFEHLLLLAEAPGHLFLAGRDRRAAVLDPVFRLGETACCGADRFLPNRGGGQRGTLALVLGAARLKRAAAVGDLAAAAF